MSGSEDTDEGAGEPTRDGLPARALVAGCGYVGGRLAELLVARGVTTWGLRRGPAGIPNIPAGVRAVLADVTDPPTLATVPGEVDAVVYAVSPGGRTADAYRAAYVDGVRNVVEAVAGDADDFGARLVLVTSTGVYGHTDGRVVDEETDPEPAGETGRVLLEAEAQARELGRPGIVLRLGGIYGPGRTRTIRRVLDGEARCPAPERYGNRIHREDAAGAALHLLSLDDPDPVYLGVDTDPAPLRDVYRWIAERAGVPDPCEEDEEETWEARGRRGTNKRCSSRRLVESGYGFRYPTFREGYGELIEEMERTGSS